MRTRALTTAAAVAGALVVATLPGAAQNMGTLYGADLGGVSVVPQVETDASGFARILVDEDAMELTWRVFHAGIASPVTAAHIHGPAIQGENAGVVIDLGADGLESPITGSTTITEDQLSDLKSGLWYVQVHSEQNPAGELRGQIDLFVTLQDGG